MRTDREKRNDELMKDCMRAWLQSKLDALERTLEEYIAACSQFDQKLLHNYIADLETKIGVLLWLLAMLRPADPNTVNQWNLEKGQDNA